MFLAWLLIACASTPLNSLAWRESWEVLVATEDGGLIDARGTVGNSGMRRGEGQIHIDRWSTNETPIFYSVGNGPNDVDISDAHDAIRVGTSLLGRFEADEHWTVRAASPNANAIIRVNPGGVVPPMSTGIVGNGQWTLSAPITHGPTHGWFTAGKRGGMLQGRAIVLHRGGDGQPTGPRRGVYILSEAATIGVDEQGDLRLSWANINGQDFDLSQAEVVRSSDGSVRMDLRPSADFWFEVIPTSPLWPTDGHLHLAAPEKWAAEVMGRGAQRQVARGQATIHVAGRIIKSAAILVMVD